MRVFRTRSGRLRLPSRGVLRDVLLVACLLMVRPPGAVAIVGLCVFLAGAALHFWSKGCLVRNWTVTISGPYRLVRHPFYLANFIIDIGICLMAGLPWLIAAYVPLFLVVYIPVIRGEERELMETHGEAYRDFSRQVPCLLPYKPHRVFGPLDLTWINIRREQEIPRLLRILAIPLYLTLAHLGWTLPAREWFTLPAFLAAAAGAVLLNAVSVLVRWDPFSDLAEAGGGRRLGRLVNSVTGQSRQ